MPTPTNSSGLLALGSSNTQDEKSPDHQAVWA